MLRLLVGQWQLKLLSLALAVGLWLFVASTEPREIMLAVPVEYIGLEGPLTLDGPRREAVDVQVHATRWAAGGVSPATVRVQVDVARLREGDNLVPLQPDAITVPAGVRVTRVAPGWVTVRLVRTATRSVRIVPRIQGTRRRPSSWAGWWSSRQLFRSRVLALQSNRGLLSRPCRWTSPAAVRR
jgi:hypothetical protein